MELQFYVEAPLDNKGKLSDVYRMSQRPPVTSKPPIASAPPSCPPSAPPSTHGSEPPSPTATKRDICTSEPPSPGGPKERRRSRSGTISEDEESKAEKIRSLRQSFASLFSDWLFSIEVTGMHFWLYICRIERSSVVLWVFGVIRVKCYCGPKVVWFIPNT